MSITEGVLQFCGASIGSLPVTRSPMRHRTSVELDGAACGTPNRPTGPSQFGGGGTMETIGGGGTTRCIHVTLQDMDDRKWLFLQCLVTRTKFQRENGRNRHFH